MKRQEQFLIYKTVEAYNKDVKDEAIKDTSIAFIEGDHTIRTHGKTFGDTITHEKGFYSSPDKLPAGNVGDWAVSNDGNNWYIYYYDKESGWTKGGRYNMDSSITSDLLDDVIKKSDIQEYLKSMYDNVYVRKDEVYTPDEWSDEPSSGGGGYVPEYNPQSAVSHIFLTQEEYDALTEYKKNALYFIIEKEDIQEWGFGGTFPITLGGGWSFGEPFPIKLT